MMIKDLKTLKEFFKTIKTPIFGAGVYAFNRLGLETIIPNYRILALRYSLDTELIKKDIEILSIEKNMGTKHIQEPRNATTVISHSKTKKYLEKYTSPAGKPAILVLKSSTKMEQTCQENNWKLLTNPTTFGKETLENKIKFRRILREIEIEVPPGKIASVDKLHYGHLINKYGLPFVIQHPTKGGGKGTFFINNQEDFNKTFKKLKGEWIEEDGETKFEAIPEAIVAKFIQGSSPSITGCVTKHGILSTNLQHQVLDIPQLFNPTRGSGLFCGHDWTSSRFSQEVDQQAYEITEKIGQYFKEMGYKGIFGLDFVLDEETEKLYLIECNPRLLGSFPTLNMVQFINNEPLILGFHILEFLDVDYEIDLEEINRLMRQDKIGAQMLPHNLTEHWARNHKQIEAGIYKLNKDKLEYLRPGYDLKHLKDKEEFLLVDGVPLKKSHFSPNRRICRILTLNQTLDNTHKQLTPWALQTAETVYRSFEMKPIKWIKFKKKINPNFIAKG
ncbi:MAG: ATP-grasp domain-containing protein [Patescibacteria group bacterium]